MLGESPRDTAMLAGTGDGRIYTLAADRTLAPPMTYEILQLDPADGSIAATFDTSPIPVSHVAFYGGDLVLFTIADRSVWRYDLDDLDGSGVHELDMIADESAIPPSLANWALAGVASSTCAPLTPRG